MIVFDQVQKSYQVGGRAIPALHPTDMTIETGEVFGIVGHSGAGKSTLVRLINLLEPPTGGRILIDDENITDYDAAELRAFRRKVGMIFQHFNLLSSKTVADNIAFPMKLAGIYSKTEIRDRVEELLARVSLTDHANKYPSQLSGGQKQRVGIARALACRPTILLCDEATSALDPQTTQSVLKLLADINRDLGLTILLITHEMAVVRDIASHVAVIDGGRIVEQGTTYDVFADPKHSTTRSFLSGITGVTLPSFIADRLQPERPQGAAQEVIRITFAGRHATDPMLAMLTSELGIAVNILAGAIEEIGPHPFGNLLVSVEAGRGAEARAYLERHELLTEVLGYVG